MMAPIPVWLMDNTIRVGTVFPYKHGSDEDRLFAVRETRMRNGKSEVRIGSADESSQWVGFWISAENYREVTRSPFSKFKPIKSEGNR